MKTRCAKCGEPKFANPSAYAARLKRFGSLENIEKSWKCANCESVGEEAPQENQRQAPYQPRQSPKHIHHPRFYAEPKKK